MKKNKFAVRFVFAGLVAALLSAGSINAHHSYAEYDRNEKVSFEGVVEEVEWVSPHVLLRLATEDSGIYRVEWVSVQQLRRQLPEHYASTLKAGDAIFVTGSVNKNPERKIITLLDRISRPADGWNWTHPRLNTSPSDR